MINIFLKGACLALYISGAAVAAGLLPASLALLAPAAALVLAAHVLETIVLFGLVRRYPGPLSTSIMLSLLFGMLHLLPLRRLPA